MSITIETNVRVVSFLDTTFDLINDIYKPYRKPNGNLVYINTTVLRQFAKSVRRRILETSNEQIFKESIAMCEEALKKSGFRENLKYVREEVDKHGKEEKKRRKRKNNLV